MDWNSLAQLIFELCLIPLLSILTDFIVKFIKKKTEEIKQKIKDSKLIKYLDLIETVVTDCVIATNQTYVEEMKGKGVFDKEAQTQAFNKTFQAVLAIIPKDTNAIFTDLSIDLNEFIKQKIEAIINSLKDKEVKKID